MTATPAPAARRIFIPLEQLAYHEAAHAVVAYVQRQRFSYVSIMNLDGSGENVCMTTGTVDPLRDATGLIAGTISEIRYCATDGGEPMPDGTVQTDWKHAVALLMAAFGPGDFKARLQQCHAEADRIVKDNWVAVEALAAALLSEGRIGYRRAREIIGQVEP